MTRELLLLHLAQAEQSLDRAKNNAYSDQLKEDYQRKLVRLFHSVKEDVISNLSTMNEAQIYDGPKKYLDFIFKSLEFLDSSTLNQIPYEIVECLNQALNESTDPGDNFIIVTSLINNVIGFSYDPSIAFDTGLYSGIEAKYGIKFSHKLVQVNLPKAFSRDYLAAVVLYHELGHFIDNRFSLMRALTHSVLSQIQAGVYKPGSPETRELEVYFPHLSHYVAAPVKGPLTPNNPYYPVYDYTLYHFMEYFCDLFASQYIGEASSYYLTYISGNFYTNWGPTHPATSNRTKVVSDWISGTPNIVVSLINQALLAVRKTALQKRYTDVAPDDFFDLIPTQINSGQELHGLMNAAWKIWLHDKDKLLAHLNSTDIPKVYKVLNNLVEKSIGNFITVNKWTKAHSPNDPQITKLTVQPDQTSALASTVPTS